MNWQEVCEHPSLQDLPFKIELDKQGKIIMSPMKVYHSIFQGELSAQLKSLQSAGKVLVECAIATSAGVKVADVAWVTYETYEQIKHETQCSIAPELCIEVLSSSNTQEEMEFKRGLYFEKGTQEFWTCSEEGIISFYDHHSKIQCSMLFPQFPNTIEL